MLQPKMMHTSYKNVHEKAGSMSALDFIIQRFNFNYDIGLAAGDQHI